MKFLFLLIVQLLTSPLRKPLFLCQNLSASWRLQFYMYMEEEEISDIYQMTTDDPV